jgi:hypothetical protein
MNTPGLLELDGGDDLNIGVSGQAIEEPKSPLFSICFWSWGSGIYTICEFSTA